MSWTAYLTDDRGHDDGQWNYTHNCNDMIAVALESTGHDKVAECGGSLGRLIGPAWWDLLDGKSGPDGAALLDHIVKGLEADPSRFRAMNPENGWGDYDSLVQVLTEMRDAVPEWPTKWTVHG